MNTVAGTLDLQAARPPSGIVAIGGDEFICDLAGCLFWPSANCLIVSDLHLEKGSSFARRGQLLPPYDTRATLVALASRIALWDPALVISLGDSFHDRNGASRLDPADRDLLDQMMSGRDWIWLTGNHDPDRPKGLPGDWACELAIGGVSLRHEPVLGSATREIAGHLHPQARIVRRGRAVRRRCFASDGKRLIMPAFGAYTGGLNICSQAFAGLFCQSDLCAHVIGRSNIYRISGRQLV